MRIIKLLIFVITITITAPSILATQQLKPSPKANISDEETVLPLYLTVSTKGMNPTDADKQFTYNAETGCYELTVNNFAKKINGDIQYMWFYQRDNDGNIIPWNVPIVTNVQFTMANLTCEYEIEKGMSSGLKIYSFAYDLEEADIKFTIKLNTYDDLEHGITFGSLVMEQLIESIVYPDNIYLWGSNIGGLQTKVWGTLTCTAEEGLYQLNNFQMPITVFDPAAGFDADQAFSFFLSTSNESITKGTKFLAPKKNDESSNEVDNYQISLKNDQTFTSTLKPTTLDASNLLCYTPGLVDMTFNIKTLEFTVLMKDALNHSTIEVIGAPNEAFEKYFTLEVNDEVYPVEVNPQNIWYTGTLNWTITPIQGWLIDVESDSDSATIVEKDGIYMIKAPENGINIKISVTENSTDGITNIYDLNGENGYTVVNMQGVVVLRNGTADDLRLLENGLYIVNGKKIVVRK